METAYLIVGTIALWAYLAGKSTNPWLRQLMFIETLLMTVAMGWIAWFSVDQSDLVALNIWRYVVSLVASVWVITYGILWMTGAMEQEEIDNGF